MFDLFPDSVDPRDWMTGSFEKWESEPSRARPGSDEFWFDYVSDMGDSFRATYSAYYLIHGDLFIGDGELLTADAPALGGDRSVSYESGDDARRLPAGAFLFCGGDAAYSVADEKTLKARLQAPSNLARAARPGAGSEGLRGLFGIPGNHDWYDSLDGYNRLFRAPVGASAPVTLAGFQAKQQASYVLLQLPFEWEFWGIDSRDRTDVDFRQKEFFKRGAAPRRLILATSRPLIVYNELRRWASDLLGKFELELEPKRGQARVYLSGDSHHYARYRVKGAGEAVSLVAGLGGASLHPPPHALGASTAAADFFPELTDARRRITWRLLNPLYMIACSGLWGIGGIVGAIVGSALAGYEGELSRLLSAFGLLNLGMQASPGDPAAPLFWAAVLLITLLVSGYSVFKYNRDEGEETAREGSSKLRRALGLVSAVLVSIAAVVLFGVWLTRGRSAPSVTLDLLVYVVMIALGPGLGVIACALAHNRQAMSSARKALVFLLGALSGLAVVGALLFTAVKGLGMLAPLWPVSTLVEWSQDPAEGGVIAYLLLTGLGALAGAVAGMVVVPIVFGWAVLVQYWLGAHYALPGAFARVDDYVCFVRFRLRRLASGETDLTGFVIGAESVSRSDLRSGRTPAPRAKLIDVFRVRG